jgi:DNA replication protein DnaC
MTQLDPDIARTRRLSIKRKLPSRALGAARNIDDGFDKGGEIWRRVNSLHRSDSWETKPSFLLTGPKGIGKTTALVAVGAREIMRGRSVWYLQLTRLARILKSHHTEKPQLRQLEKCDLLLIDELHRYADLPGWVRAEAAGLIDHRYGNLLQMGAAGTLDPKELGQVIGPEVMERFQVIISSEERSYR